MTEEGDQQSTLTTITSTCTKRYVIKALTEVVSPTISTGKIPEITAQNTPVIRHNLISLVNLNSTYR